MRLTGVSFAHPEVGSAMRAELSVPLGGTRGARQRLRAAGHDLFFLATCLRVEVAWMGDASASDVLVALYGRDARAGGAAVREDEAAFLHLCRVAAGLDSPLIGEPEVLGQFRQAVASLDQPTDLSRIMEAAVAVARGARRDLGQVPRGSLASVAAAHVAGQGRVGVLGGGAMAKAAIEALSDVEVTVFARRNSPVAGHKPRTWDAVPEALATFPAIISTVPGKAPVLSQDEMKRAFAGRLDPLLLVDLGMPPAFVGPFDHGRVRYLGVDEVATSVTSPGAASAEVAIAAAATAAWRRLTAADRAASVIAAVMESAEKAVAEEVRRFAPRLATAEDPEGVLQQAARTVARRVLHPAISYLRATDDKSVEVVAEAFGVDR